MVKSIHWETIDNPVSISPSANTYLCEYYLPLSFAQHPCPANWRLDLNRLLFQIVSDVFRSDYSVHSPMDSAHRIQCPRSGRFLHSIWRTRRLGCCMFSALPPSAFCNYVFCARFRFSCQRCLRPLSEPRSLVSRIKLGMCVRM